MNEESLTPERLIAQLGSQAREAALKLATITETQKNEALRLIADRLRANVPKLLEANALDLASADDRGLSPAMIDRLRLTEPRVLAIAKAVEEVADLSDPVGEELESWTRPNGLKMRKVRVPIGVIGIIFESRPNVTVDAAVLCLKTGNATILRGGSEAFHSNMALASVMQEGILAAGLPEHSVQLIPITDRSTVPLLAGSDQFLDLIIPRGGRSLIETVVSHARVPVIKHYDGICHVYVHPEADVAMAESILVNSKCQKPGVCNALETALFDARLDDATLQGLAQALIDAGVELRVDEAFLSRWKGAPLPLATEEDWKTEYLNLTLSVKMVHGMEEAIEHIHRYGSRHTESIVTQNEAVARQFQAEVDSAVVMWNASTRFNDGGEFGFGAEIGISTDKLHARGPMGLAELTSYKYLVDGEGQVRS